MTFRGTAYLQGRICGSGVLAANAEAFAARTPLPQCRGSRAQKRTAYNATMNTRRVVVACIAMFVFSCAPAAPEPGVQAYERGNYSQAAREFERAAQAGNRLAQYNYAMLLLRGEGVAANGEEGLKWLR